MSIKYRKFGIHALLDALCIEFANNIVPDWFLGTLYYVLFSIVAADKPRSGKMFIDYYLSDATLDAIGEKYGITSECVRQHIQWCLRKLRHPSRRQILSVGVEAYYTQESKQLLDETYNNGYQDGILSVINNSEVIQEKRMQLLTAMYDTKIWNMDGMPSRLRRLLCVAGYETVGDVIKAGREKIRRVRQIGDKTYAELVDILVRDFGEKREDWAI